MKHFLWLPFLCLVSLLLAACGPTSPVSTTLSALAAAQTDFDGRTVRVTGLLRTFEQPRHYWIENDALDRVAIEGVEDPVTMVGQRVTVTGVFEYKASSGRKIRVEEIVVVATTQPLNE